MGNSATIAPKERHGQASKQGENNGVQEKDKLLNSFRLEPVTKVKEANSVLKRDISQHTATMNTSQEKKKFDAKKKPSLDKNEDELKNNSEDSWQCSRKYSPTFYKVSHGRKTTRSTSQDRESLLAESWESATRKFHSKRFP